MPAQFPKTPRGRFNFNFGVGRRTVDSLGWKSHPLIPPMGGRTFFMVRSTNRFAITGVTRNNVGATLGNCDVRLFKADTDQLIAITISDGSGNFTFTIGTNEGWYWIEAYLSGAPDRAGTSLRTLAAVMV